MKLTGAAWRVYILKLWRPQATVEPAVTLSQGRQRVDRFTFCRLAASNQAVLQVHFSASLPLV